MANTLLRALNRHGAVILALSLFVGLALPQAASTLRPVLGPSVWAMLFLSLLRIQGAEAMVHVRRPALVLAAVAGILIAAPLAVWAVVEATGLSPEVAAAIVLMAGAPPITASPAFALIVGLDAPLALVVLVAATIISPITLPFISVQLLGLDLSIDTADFVTRLAAFFGSAFIAAAVVKKVMGNWGWGNRGNRRLEDKAPVLEGLILLALVLFGVAVMDGITLRLLDDPWHIIGITATAFAVNLGLQLAGALAFLAVGRRSALSLGFSFGNRNMAVLLAVLPPETSADTLLFFALGQFPVYMLPALLTPVYRWALRRNDPP